MYVIAAAPLLVVAACGSDKGLKGHVTYRTTLPSAAPLLVVAACGMDEG